MFRYDNHVAGRPSWRSCPIHLSDQKPAPLQLKYLMFTQLVSTCLHIISMKQQDCPGGLIPSTSLNVRYLVVTFSNFTGNICQRTWVRYVASFIPAERLDVRSADWHMFRCDNYVAGSPTWRSCPTHLSDRKPAPLQLKYLILTQLVRTYLHIISMKQQDHPGGLIPSIGQIQNQLHHRWNFWCWLSWLADEFRHHIHIVAYLSCGYCQISSPTSNHQPASLQGILT